MDPVFALIFFLLIALIFSFLCSVLEAVLLSITPSYIATQKGEKAKRLENLKKNIDMPLSAILTLNTFAHTIGAAGVGAAAQSIWGEASLTIVSALVTIVILIGSEIIPKTIGAVYWKRLASPVAITCQWLTWLLYPFVIFCQLITRVFKDGEQKSVLSRVVVNQVVNKGFQDGLIHQHEKDIIDNLLKKEALKTAEIMIPRDGIVMLNEDDAIGSVKHHSPAWHVSRIPIYNGDMDNVTGYVLKDEILVLQLAGERHGKLASIGRAINSVGVETGLKDLYDQLVTADEHIAIVKDGKKVVGIVTMEDVLEELLGQEITDESDIARDVQE